MSMLNHNRINRPYLSMAALLCISVLYVAFCQAQVIDGDYWWYLASGKLIAAGGIPDINSFAHTYGDYPWKFTQWLFASLLFAVSEVAGSTGVEILFLTVLCASFLLTLDTIRLKAGRIDFALALPVMFWAIWASSVRFIIRPHLATFFFLALMLNLIERRPRYLNLFFFMIAAIWSNLHAGFFFGLVACVVFALDAYLKKDSGAFRAALWTLFWFFSGTFVNVNFAYPYYYIVINLWVTHFAPVAEMANIAAWNTFSFWGMSTFLLASLVFQYKARDFRSILLFLLFFPLSLFAVRIIPKMILLALPGAYCAFQGRVALLKRPMYSALVLLLWLLTGLAFVASGAYRPVTGWGIGEQGFPAEAGSFIETNALKGKMYNGFDEGGYLAYRFYPERRIFVDGRVQAYPPVFFREYYQANGVPAWQALMDKYEVSYALIRRQIAGGQETFNRGAYLQALGWPLIYLDGKYLIYARPGRGNDRVIDRNQFRIISWGATAESLKKMAGSNPEQLLLELKRIPVQTLRLQSDVLRFADAAFYAGDDTLCEGILQQGMTLPGTSSPVLIKLAALHASQGRFDLSLLELQRLIDTVEDPKVKEQASGMLNRVKGLRQKSLPGSG